MLVAWKFRKILSVLVVILVLVILSIYCYAANGEIDTGKIDSLGMSILKVCQKIAYWALLIKCFMDIFHTMKLHDVKKVGEIILNYMIIYAALFMLPWCFALIEGAFK
jgi:ubiquinone biosynthesis protein Coq4